MKLTINSAYSILVVIRQCQQEAKAPSVKFSYMLARNAKLLSSELEPAFETVRSGLDLSFLDDYNADKATLDEAQLAAKYPTAKSVLDAVKTKEAEIGKQEVEIALHTLPLAEWPDLPAALVDTLFPLIEEV